MKQFFVTLINEQQKKMKYGTFNQLKAIREDLASQTEVIENFELDTFDNNRNVTVSGEAFQRANTNDKQTLARLSKLVDETKSYVNDDFVKFQESCENTTIEYIKNYDESRGEHKIDGIFSEFQTDIQRKVVLVIDFYYGLASILDDQSKLNKRRQFELTLNQHLVLLKNTTEELHKIVTEIEKRKRT